MCEGELIMAKIAWLAREKSEDDWYFLTTEPDSWHYSQIKRIVYFEVED